MAEPMPPDGPWETDDRYAGMTTNERMFNAGLLDAWDAAAARRDRQAMIEILRAVSLTQDAAEYTADFELQRTKTQPHKP